MTILGKMPMCQPLNTRVPEDIKEEATSPDAAVSFYLEELLDDRKKATRQQQHMHEIENGNSAYTKALFEKPVLVVIEEAHAFIPKNENIDTKYIAGKVAQEVIKRAEQLG